MDKTELNRLKKRIDEYFDTLTEEKLQRDLKKANYAFYKTVKEEVIPCPPA